MKLKRKENRNQAAKQNWNLVVWMHCKIPYHTFTYKSYTVSWRSNTTSVTLEMDHRSQPGGTRNDHAKEDSSIVLNGNLWRCLWRVHRSFTTNIKNENVEIILKNLNHFSYGGKKMKYEKKWNGSNYDISGRNKFASFETNIINALAINASQRCKWCNERSYRQKRINKVPLWFIL